MTISEYAQKFIGRSYIWGGDGSGKCGGGFDCSGLVLAGIRNPAERRQDRARNLHSAMQDRMGRRAIEGRGA